MLKAFAYISGFMACFTSNRYFSSILEASMPKTLAFAASKDRENSNKNRLNDS